MNNQRNISRSGLDGESGENCGEINIYNKVKVYAYGGAGGSGGGQLPDTNASSPTGGGGYPAAGIGGGRSRRSVEEII